MARRDPFAVLLVLAAILAGVAVAARALAPVRVMNLPDNPLGPEVGYT